MAYDKGSSINYARVPRRRVGFKSLYMTSLWGEERTKNATNLCSSDWGFYQQLPTCVGLKPDSMEQKIIAFFIVPVAPNFCEDLPWVRDTGEVKELEEMSGNCRIFRCSSCSEFLWRSSMGLAYWRSQGIWRNVWEVFFSLSPQDWLLFLEAVETIQMSTTALCAAKMLVIKIWVDAQWWICSCNTTNKSSNRWLLM